MIDPDKNPEDLRVGTLSTTLPRPSRSVVTALEYLCFTVEQDHGCRHGRTAMYWNLVAVCQQHMAHNQGE